MRTFLFGAWCLCLMAGCHRAIGQDVDEGRAVADAVATWQCGVPESAEPELRAAWPPGCRALRLHLDASGLSGLSAGEFQEVAKASCAACSEVSGLSIVLASSPDDADILAAGERMRGGILAYAYFPGQSCDQRLTLRFNAGVKWTRQLFLDTCTHELGHNFGLPHTRDSRDIMFPSLSAGRPLDGKFGPHYSIPEMQMRYGPFRPRPVPPVVGVARSMLWFAAGVAIGAGLAAVVTLLRAWEWLGWFRVDRRI